MHFLFRLSEIIISPHPLSLSRAEQKLERAEQIGAFNGENTSCNTHFAREIRGKRKEEVLKGPFPSAGEKTSVFQRIISPLSEDEGETESEIFLFFSSSREDGRVMCAPGDTMDLGIPWRAPLLVFLLPLERRRRHRLSSSHRQRKEEEEEETINNIFLGIGKGRKRGEGRGGKARGKQTRIFFFVFSPCRQKGRGKGWKDSGAELDKPIQTISAVPCQVPRFSQTSFRSSEVGEFLPFA